MLFHSQCLTVKQFSYLFSEGYIHVRGNPVSRIGQIVHIFVCIDGIAFNDIKISAVRQIEKNVIKKNTGPFGLRNYGRISVEGGFVTEGWIYNRSTEISNKKLEGAF